MTLLELLNHEVSIIIPPEEADNPLLLLDTVFDVEPIWPEGWRLLPTIGLLPSAVDGEWTESGAEFWVKSWQSFWEDIPVLWLLLMLADVMFWGRYLFRSTPEEYVGKGVVKNEEPEDATGLLMSCPGDIPVWGEHPGTDDWDGESRKWRLLIGDEQLVPEGVFIEWEYSSCAGDVGVADAGSRPQPSGAGLSGNPGRGDIDGDFCW
jgi:hypothetical protein